MKPLTAKQRRFVEAYRGEALGNATKAARIAGYGTPNVSGTKVMKSPAVRAALAAPLAILYPRAGTGRVVEGSAEEGSGGAEGSPTTSLAPAEGSVPAAEGSATAPPGGVSEFRSLTSEEIAELVEERMVRTLRGEEIYVYTGPNGRLFGAPIPGSPGDQIAAAQLLLKCRGLLDPEVQINVNTELKAILVKLQPKMTEGAFHELLEAMSTSFGALDGTS